MRVGLGLGGGGAPHEVRVLLVLGLIGVWVNWGSGNRGLLGFSVSRKFGMGLFQGWNPIIEIWVLLGFGVHGSLGPLGESGKWSSGQIGIRTLRGLGLPPALPVEHFRFPISGSHTSGFTAGWVLLLRLGLPWVLGAHGRFGGLGLAHDIIPAPIHPAMIHTSRSGVNLFPHIRD